MREEGFSDENGGMIENGNGNVDSDIEEPNNETDAETEPKVLEPPTPGPKEGEQKLEEAKRPEHELYTGPEEEQT